MIFGYNMIYGFRTTNHIGDSAIMTGAIHNVKMAYPQVSFAYVGWAPELWENNPDITRKPPMVILPKILYGSLDEEQRAAFGNVVEAFTHSICKNLQVPMVPVVTRTPYLILTEKEKEESRTWNGKWLLNANCQSNSRSKGYPHWQEVANALKDDINIVQVGSQEHRNISPSLENVTDYRGRSENVRHYLSMIYGCDGIISPPSGIMNMGAAFGKRMVIVNGARELTIQTNYDNTVYISNECCGYGKERGCIALTFETLRPCRNYVVRNHIQYSRCMDMIDPGKIVEGVRSFL